MTILTLVVALPLLAAIALHLCRRIFGSSCAWWRWRRRSSSRCWASCFSRTSTTGTEGYQFVTTIPLLGADGLGIHCRLGVDGINIGLILMGTLVAFAAACVSWEIKEREKESTSAARDDRRILARSRLSICFSSISFTNWRWCRRSS